MLLCLLLTACTQSEFINLAQFIENFNAFKSDDSIDFTDFSVSTGSGGESVYTYEPKDCEEKIIVRLVADDDLKISSCRVVLAKSDHTGQKLAYNKELHRVFYELCKRTVCAFTFCSGQESEALIEAFSLSLKQTLTKEGELTRQQGDYYYTYLSNSLCSEFIISNKWLCEMETTLKPESKNAFLNSTSVRTETVPHR